MRIITGDECGLLKETIPELCRPDINNGVSPYSAVHHGRARPSATSIQAAAASYGNYNTTDPTSSGGGQSVVVSQRAKAVSRLETNDDAQCREKGIVSLTFLPPNNANDGGASSSAAFQFAALRMNGVVETWTGNRTIPGNEEESNVTAASYEKSGGLVNSVLLNQDDEKESEEEISSSNIVSDENTNDASSSVSVNKGWNAKQPIRPIGMVLSSINKIPMLATCDSIGTVSLLDPNQMTRGVVSTFNAFGIDCSLPGPSSSKNAIGKGTLTYTKGRFANSNIATSLAMCGGGERIIVGGRERGMRVLDLETGKLLWKAKNLPPDPQTLLQQGMWTTSIQFLHTPTTATSSSQTNNNNNIPTNLVATGTAYKQVQIYDVRVSATSAGVRRPVLYTPEHLLTHRITSLCQLPNGNTLAVGDSIGDIHLLDIRKMHSGKQYTKSNSKSSKEGVGLGRLVGPGGSIRQLGMHPTLPYLACVGLDRKLWTWDVNKGGGGGKMMDCVYLRQRLNCLLFCEDETWSGGGDDTLEEQADEDMTNDGDGGIGIGEEDEVEDYVDSDDDDSSKNAGDKVLNQNDGINKQKGKTGGTKSEETASDSEEGSSEDESEDDEELEDDESISEEEIVAPAAAETNPKRRRKK